MLKLCSIRWPPTHRETNNFNFYFYCQPPPPGRNKTFWWMYRNKETKKKHRSFHKMRDARRYSALTRSRSDIYEFQIYLLCHMSYVTSIVFSLKFSRFLLPFAFVSVSWVYFLFIFLVWNWSSSFFGSPVKCCCCIYFEFCLYSPKRSRSSCSSRCW